jgi:hypothetical protein
MHGMNYNFRSNFCVEMVKWMLNEHKPGLNQRPTFTAGFLRRHSAPGSSVADARCDQRKRMARFFRIGTGTLATALDVQLCLRKPGQHTRISERMTRKLTWYELYNIMGQNIILSTIVWPQHRYLSCARTNPS